MSIPTSVEKSLIGRPTTRVFSAGAMALVAATGLVAGPGVTDASIIDYQMGFGTTPGVSVARALNNSSGEDLLNALLEQQDAGEPVVVKVTEELTDETADFWFKDTRIEFDVVLADFEGAFAALKTRKLAEQVLDSRGGRDAQVSNFALDPFHPDPTQPNPNAGLTDLAYSFSGVNAASEQLYPGSPLFRNPEAGNSSAPNIRSAFFTLPIARLSGVESELDEDHGHRPFATRFNNWGNEALHNTDDTPFEFAFETDDQLLSRGDFQALISHYRIRGADGLVLFEPGVIGYTKEQMREDALAGWGFMDPVYDFDDDAHPASLTTQVTVRDGDSFVDKSIESAGVVWSGVVNGDLLAILISNLDGVPHDVRLPSEVEGLDLFQREFTVNAGSHLLLEFVDVGGIGWGILDGDGSHVFVDHVREGVGIPEPTSSLAMAILGMVFGLGRPSRETR